MFSQVQQRSITLQQKIRLPAYQTLYQNVRNRLCNHVETLQYDFFTAFHQADDEFFNLYYNRPTTYQCITSPGLTDPGGRETTYLVIGGLDRVVLLLEPMDALVRNLPFLSVLEGNFFRPCLESAPAYWQKHIEPMPRKIENVLHPQLITNEPHEWLI